MPKLAPPIKRQTASNNTNKMPASSSLPAQTVSLELNKIAFTGSGVA